MNSQLGSQQSGSLNRALITGIAIVIIIGAVVGGYFAFRRTLIADIRESTSGVDTTDQIAYGELLFQTRVCGSCHTLDMAGTVGDTGPNLTGIGARHDAAYVYQAIMQPNAVIAPNCPEGPCQPGVMPDFSAILDDDQANALVVYLLSQ
ncbi:MAG: cytochrome c [Pleurocapsa minor GSE-CHR-MK-17-07R]|jgi:mono/diheme cytochrome c family protein|nr:cytochrome c [Pleurocapsa minor GSE-CHR-MK 17-07R]